MRHAAVVALLLMIASPAVAQNTVPVTVDNFPRAETDRYIVDNVKISGGLGKFHHSREPTSIDNQTVIRMNRDTLYSFGVFDLDAGAVTITMPDAGKRFMSMQVINEDHYVPAVFYGAGSHTLSKHQVGTRYVFIGIRTLVDPNDAKDLDTVHRLQDAIKISQKDAGKLDLPNWNEADRTEIRNALLVLAKHMSGFGHAFGTKDQVDPVHHLIGTAAGWGGNPDKDASYASFSPAKGDGKTIYKLNVPANVPVNAFWSISVYNAKGFFEKNPYDSYSLNNITAKKNSDGSVTIQFGGCDGNIPNCLPIMAGWNYTVRMYRPRPEILSGKWKFPEAQPVN